MGIPHEVEQIRQRQAQEHEERMQQEQAQQLNAMQQEQQVQQAQQEQAQQPAYTMNSAKEMYFSQIVNMEDTAKLGKKSFKSNTAAKKARNERIDRARLMTARATEYTLDVQETLKEAYEQQAEIKHPHVEVVLAKLEQYPFSPQMFFSSVIRSNLAAYISRLQEYDYLKRTAGESEEYKDRIEAMAPLMNALRHRLRVYCEQNRVRLDGTILDDAQEAVTLSDEEAADWYEQTQQHTVRTGLLRPGAVDAITDEDRKRIGDMRKEAGRADATQHAGALQWTREDAISSHSDRLEQESRDQLRRFNRGLYDAGMKDLAFVVNEYLNGTRYVVGYTEERKRLVTAMKAVDAALATQQSEEARQILTAMKTYFAHMTNGNLVIPEDTPEDQILNYADVELKETGGSGRGSTRNSMIRLLSHWSDQTDTPLFSHEPVINDLKQRLVSNCYMVASTASLVELNPDKLKECIRDNGDGTVTVRLYLTKDELKRIHGQAPDGEEKKNEAFDTAADDDLGGFAILDEDEMEQAREANTRVATYVTVKKEIPRINDMDPMSAGTLWMQMIEKACAYVGREGRTGYQSLWYGEGGAFLARLTGVESVTDYVGANRAALEIDGKKDQLFRGICDAGRNHMIYHAGSNQQSQDGLNSGHAYSVLGGKEVDGKKYVLLRNPYSTHSLQYDEQQKKSKTGWLLSAGSDETYGQFYMEYEDFLQAFDKVSHTNLSENAE